MIRTAVLSLLLGATVSACTARFTDLRPMPISWAPYETVQSWPTPGVDNTVQVGESMIRTFNVATIPSVRLSAPVRHVTAYKQQNFGRNEQIAIEIEPSLLVLAATDDQLGQFFEAPNGVRASYGSSDKFGASQELKGGLYRSKNGQWFLYWRWSTLGQPVASAITGQFVVGATEFPPTKSAFQRELVYSGTAQSVLSIFYREYMGDLARPAFSQELKYDFSKGLNIGYKTARFELLKADNTTITYRVETPLK